MQSKNPELLSEQEIEERVNTLAERIERLSYNKWAQKPVAWTWRGVIGKATEFEENKKNQDITARTPIFSEQDLIEGYSTED